MTKEIRMDSIEEIYSNNVYAPFLLYCKSHRYRKMTDLLKCSFDELEDVPGISGVLASRVILIYRTYKKNHPDHFINVKPPRKSAKKTDIKLSEDVLVGVQEFLRKNPTKLVHISDIAKAVGVTKKAQLQSLMEKVDWCKAVDGSTYFYSGKEQ